MKPSSRTGLFMKTFAALIFCVVALPALAAAQWQHVSQGVWLNDIAYGAGRYVTTGYTGTYTSTDGITWQQTTLPANATIDYHRVLWNAAQSRFVAAGYSGWVATSPDGMNWTTHQTGLGTLFDVTYAGGQYVAVEDAGHIATSPDGINWTVHSTPASPNAYLFGVAWNGTTYVAAGYCLSQTSCPGGADVVLTSPDGATWNLADPGTSASPILADGVAWGNGEFVVVGEFGVITSPDGTTWTLQTPNPEQLFAAGNNNALRFDGSRFVGTGFDYSSGNRDVSIFTSSDGASWTSHVVPDPFAPDSFATSAEHINGSYFITTSDGSVFTTPDLAAWTTNRAGSALGTDNYAGIAFSGSRYLAYVAPAPVRGVPVSSAYVSLDGLTWNQQGTESSQCWSMAYAAGVFACTANVRGKLYTSPDESNWVTRTAGIDPNTYVSDLLGTSAGFIAVGQNDSGGNSTSVVLTSPDGASWTSQSSAAVAGVYLNQVVAGAGGYYALGDHLDTATNQQIPHLLFSTDGTAWSQLTPDWPSDFSPTVLVANSSVLVAAGTNYRAFATCPPGACQSEVFTSTDGTHWTQRDVSALGIPNGTYWGSSAAGGGLLELNGEAGNTGHVVYLASHDGAQWTYTDLTGTFAGAAENGMLWSGTQFVTAVSQGGIFRLAGIQLHLSLHARTHVRAGRRYHYRLRVQNTSTASTATGITVTDQLPAGVQFLSARVRRSAGNCSASGQTVTCTLSSPLAAGARAVIVIRVRAPHTTGNLVDHAEAVADQPVTDGSGNIADATTAVVCHGRHCTP